jgi:ribose 5-phosphate isomerase A
MTAEQQKQRAGEAALGYVSNGMTIGIGTGSTADHFTRALGEKVSQGWIVKGVPTSEKTAELASDLNIPLVSLDDVTHIDVTVDGADEIDKHLQLIKGGGGALLREKIVATASRKIVTIADESKLVETLGAFALPIEIVDFASERGLEAVTQICKSNGCHVTSSIIRLDPSDERFITDGGHLIVDCACQAIPDAKALATALNQCPWVVDHGLFIGLSSIAILGTNDGVRLVEAE